ncbi:hypothetical protein [Laspinema olomoucense]|uniref:Uncharacterized protein n=1 Tax=Laspinema olomoucense D3b TaxID=2953688 RepID=A0ABT2NF76_9CYAN|nr:MULTISPECIES: hypothetical protein [unclassified Laspinema]MCT7981349.1 hypothetical protein [Laspinema sp. D3b]MCT7989339.1 hypothetical protein [Laspinema sp. D3a]
MNRVEGYSCDRRYIPALASLWRTSASRYGSTCCQIPRGMETISKRETDSLKPDINVKQKTDISAFALNNIFKFILPDLRHL